MPLPFASTVTTAFAGSGLATADWIVLGAYFLALVLIGVLSGRRKVRGTDEYFLAGRSMPIWAVAISILSTAQSAATYTGVPESAYVGNLSYLSSNIGAVAGAILLALFFIPAYYRLGVGTPYQLLEARFGRPSRLATSATYMVGRVFSSGARVYVGALPAAILLFGNELPGHIVVTVAACMVLGVVISFLGGISSVIWVDVLQVTVYLGAALATVAVLLHRIPVDLEGIWAALAHSPSGASKLNVITPGLDPGAPGLGFDPSAEFTLLTAFTGFTLLTLASHGMDQDLVQRMLTCRSGAKGAWSVISGVLVGIPAVMIFLALGLLLWIFYARPDVMGTAAPGYLPATPKEAFQTFAVRELPLGLAGLFVAGLFAVGPAGINSSLNAMASTLVSDFYRPLRPGRSERHYLSAGRAAVVFWGVVLGAFAIGCIHWHRASGQTLLSFVLSVMNFAYAGLLGVFLTALFTRRGNNRSVLAAILTGFVVVLLFQPLFWLKLVEWFPGLGPIRIEGAETPIEAVKRRFAWLRFAYPWHLVFGAAAAFAMCCLGSSRARPADPVR